MPEWRIYSSEDIVDWQLESVISPKQNYMDDSSTSCWAGDAATRNGKAYFYFSNHNINTGYDCQYAGRALQRRTQQTAFA